LLVNVIDIGEKVAREALKYIPPPFPFVPVPNALLLINIIIEGVNLTVDTLINDIAPPEPVLAVFEVKFIIFDKLKYAADTIVKYIAPPEFPAIFF
jgi:hypothetical protein